jgi:hypothetical protein
VSSHLTQHPTCDGYHCTVADSFGYRNKIVGNASVLVYIIAKRMKANLYLPKCNALARFSRTTFTTVPLLYATPRSGNFDLLDMFQGVNVTDTSVKDNGERTILHWLAGVSERKPGDKQRV